MTTLRRNTIAVTAAALMAAISGTFAVAQNNYYSGTASRSASLPYPPGVIPPKPTYAQPAGYGAGLPANYAGGRPANGGFQTTPPNTVSPMPPGPTFQPGWQPPPLVQASPSQEQRVSRLEQTAFGSTYPEHEVDDRIEHLEREVFGKVGGGDIESRIAGLEAKLGGGGAFSRNTPLSPPLYAASQASYQPPPPAPPMPLRATPAATGRPPVPAAATSPVSAPPVSAPYQQSPSTPDREAGEYEVAVESIPSDEQAGDYFGNIQLYPGNSCAHWKRFPIRIHLPAGSTESWKGFLNGAVQKWRQSIPVLIAAPSEPADVDISYINHLQPRQLGMTSLEILNGQMRVTIHLLRPSYYPPDVPERTLACVATHELGHALGLWGHSPNPSDIMHALDEPKSKSATISPRDLNTLKRVYQAPALPASYQSPQPVGWSFTHYVPLRK